MLFRSNAIKKSKIVAIGIGSKTIRPEHLFLAFIDDEQSDVYSLLREMNLNIDAIKSTLKDWSNTYQYKLGVFSLKVNSIIALDSETKKILDASKDRAKLIGVDEVGSEDVFYAILENKTTNAKGDLVPGNFVAELFSKTPQTFKNLIAKLNNEEEEIYNNLDMEEENVPKSNVNKNSKTKLIDQFGIDLTKLAKEGSLDPVIGRKNEIKRISQILSRRKKNNPVLVGEPGVGKSAIAEGMAILIVEGNVPENLKDKRIITLDMGSLVAGTKYRGEFEQRLRGIIKEMQENSNIILFIDEIHTIIGAGSAQGSLDASNMLKPALSRGNFRCIGATTYDEYRRSEERRGG